MTRRRRPDTVVVIWWRDIPAQVTARGTDGPIKHLLPARFQHAIDRAATVAGLTDAHSYVAEWRRTTEPLGSDPNAEVLAVAERLDAAHPRELLEALVARGGVTESGEPTGADAGG